MSSCRLKGERRMNWSKWGRSWRRQKFIKICTWGKLPPRQELYLASGKNPAQEEHDEKCLVLHLSEGGWGMAVCHHKYAIEKYVTTNMQCYGMLPRVGGYLQGVFCSAFPFKIANVPNHCCDWDLNQHPKTPIFVELISERKAAVLALPVSYRYCQFQAEKTKGWTSLSLEAKSKCCIEILFSFHHVFISSCRW